MRMETKQSSETIKFITLIRFILVVSVGRLGKNNCNKKEVV